MSTNVANPMELRRVLDAVGVQPSVDGVGYVISAPLPANAGYEPAPATVAKRVRAGAARQPHKLEVDGASPSPATNFGQSAIGLDGAESCAGLTVGLVNSPRRPIDLGDASYRRVATAARIRQRETLGCKLKYWLAICFQRNRRRHALARWLSVSPQFRRMS